MSATTYAGGTAYDDALADVADGATVLVGGFGMGGMPAEVIEALDGITLPPATARLGPAVDVLAERALVVPVDGVDALAEAVRERTKRIGEPPPKRFLGHLTLARVKPRAHMPRTLGAAISTGFDVEDISLVQSRLGSQGPRYDVLMNWAVA